MSEDGCLRDGYFNRIQVERGGLQEAFTEGVGSFNGLTINEENSIDMGGNKEIHMVPEYTQALQHDERDFGHHKPDMVHLKITSRWAFVEKTGVKFVWIKPDWHHKNPLAYWTVPGIIEYKYQHGVLHNLMIPYNTKLQIDTGTPWLQLIPLSEKPIEVKCHLVSTQELEQIMNANAQISTTGGYLKKIKDIRKQQERLDEND